MSEISTLEGAWEFANQWWQAGPSQLTAGFKEALSAMRSRGGYHSLSHLERMLAKYGQYCRVVDCELDPRLVGWVFAHDLVYVPGSASNESESADQMDWILRVMGAQRFIEPVDRVAIESTKTHEAIDPSVVTEPELRDSIHLLHDLDLEILGSSRVDYEVYVRSVYVEYLLAAEVPGTFHPLWLKGRRGFLEGMLRRRVFKTAAFEMFEGHARDNMRVELDGILREIGRAEIV